MMYTLRKIFRFFYSWLLVKPLCVIRLLKYKSQYYGETYYPELCSKSKGRILLEQLKHIVKYNSFNEYYYLYGLDIKNFRNSGDYLDYGLFMRRRDYLNSHAFGLDYSYTGILRDKFYFSLLMEKWGFPVPESFGLIDRGCLYLSGEQKEVPLSDIVKYERDLVGKPLNGIGGIGIFFLKTVHGRLIYNDEEITLEKFRALVGEKRFFLQDRIPEQHDLIKTLYPQSINNLRITTVRNLHSGQINVMGRMLLMGARNAKVSNWHYGGIVVNIDETGKFDKYGFSLHEKRVVKHPETGVVFEGLEVPYFEQALQAAVKCHERLYGIHSIGWDFAILPDGVMFIEGNDDWGMAAHQMVDKGLVRLFKENYY